MKLLYVIFFIVPFMMFAQNNELKQDKNNRNFVVQKNKEGQIVNIVPVSGVDHGIVIENSGFSVSNVKTSSWQVNFTKANRVFKDVYFANNQVGFLVSELGAVIKTTNGGSSWSEIMFLNFPYYWYGVYAFSPDTVVIAGFNNQSPTTQGVIKWSFNGGASWSNDVILTLPGNGVGWLDYIHFWDKQHGIVANSLGGGFWYTTNGGGNWNSWHFVKADPAGWMSGHINFFDDGNIFAGGISQLRSSDFGHTWSAKPHIDEIFDGGVDFMSDYMHGLSAGGSISPDVAGWIHKTENGGLSWSPRLNTFNYPIRSTKIFDDHNFLIMGGAVLGNMGGIYSSSDAGATWNLEQNTTAEIFTYHITYPTTDSMTIWAVGAAGLGFTGKLYKKTVHYGLTPVEFKSFTAQSDKGNVALNWSTATETNNRGFEIERNTGQRYVSIGYIAGHGTTTEKQIYTYTDTKAPGGTVSYRLKQVDYDGKYKYSDVVEVNVANNYSLGQNYPNPFNPSTKIAYSIPQDAQVKITVYSMLGEKITTLVNQMMKAGNYDVEFNASSYPSGIYFYHLETGNYSAVKKMSLLK